MPSDPALSLFQKILLATDGTVTDLIALYTGETIRVQKLEQSVREMQAPAEFACPAATRLLIRKILLSGTSKNYLFASSMFVLERFPPAIQSQLLDTDKPIGLIWKEARLETYREIVEQTIEPCAEIAMHFDVPLSAPFIARTYFIHHAGKPLGAITEKWPSSHFR